MKFANLIISKKQLELIAFMFIYIFLFTNAIIMNDSIFALISAFCGISYTILAGKGYPVCYLIGVVGSCIYAYLSFKNALWGNLVLYAGYYVPMQITGFFQWRRNLKPNSSQIIKTILSNKEKLFIIIAGISLTVILSLILFRLGDTNPIIDSVTTVFSVIGMLLTVKRCFEQWIIWIIVNGLSLLMWLKIAYTGVKVYSTVYMWAVYFLLALYFYIIWKKEVNQ